MRKSVKSALAATLCAATALSALPPEVLAAPMSAADPASVGLAAPVENARYRRYPRRYYGYYGYDPSGAIFAGAMLGLMGAGIAAASRPRYYGYPYYPGYYGWGYPGYYGWGW